ncbi:MAG: Veg family protein [Bacilli bacterium]|nr:Veg family protein [Bacilli bacterium]MDD4298024.1 Veg family protein [Bacilli bacterium]
MIEKIKENMEEHIGEEVKIVFNCGRNKTEEFDGVITEMYNFVFVVQLKNEVNEVKSFTYTDILTQTIEIYYK